MARREERTMLKGLRVRKADMDLRFERRGGKIESSVLRCHGRSELEPIEA